MKVVYFLKPTDDIDEIKDIYRKQEEERFPNMKLLHLDEALTPASRVCTTKYKIENLIIEAKRQTTFVIHKLSDIRNKKEFAQALRARALDVILVRIIRENIQIEPNTIDGAAFIACIENASDNEKNYLESKAIFEKKLSDETIEKIREKRKKGESPKSIAEEHNIGRSTIYRYTKDIKIPRIIQLSNKQNTIFKKEFAYKTPKEIDKDSQFEILFKQFIASVRAETTKQGYYYSIIDFMRFYKKNYNTNIKNVSNINLNVAIDYKSYLTSKYINKGSIHSRISSLKAFEKFLFESDCISKRSVNKLKTPHVKENKISTDPFELNELNQLIYTAQSMIAHADTASRKFIAHRNFIAIHILAATGMRVGSLLSIKIDDIKKLNENTKIYFNTKAKSLKHSFNISSNLAKHIDDYISLWIDPAKTHTYLIHTLKNPYRPISDVEVRRNLDKIIDIACSNTHNRKLTTHSFRVTWACEAYKAGINSENIRIALGHSNINQTFQYIKLNEPSLNTSWINDLPSVLHQSTTQS